MIRKGERIRSQIAVIGSGPGGAITACLLAEAGREVLLLEEGPFLGLDSCAPFSRDEMLQKYRNGGLTLAMGNPKVQYVEGRCVGGGSEINSGLYHRTPPGVLEEWQKEFKVDGLRPEELVPHFEACERDVSVSLSPFVAPAASLRLDEGAARLKWKSTEIPRWYRYEEKEGITVQKGRRQSMTETYIPRALKAGCRLMPQTRIISFGQAAGKWLLKAERRDEEGRLHRTEIETETLFLCAGAIQTPTLLRRSGIMNQVGNSLRLHPMIKVIARFPEEINFAGMGVPVHQVKEFAPRISFGCSISSPPYLAIGMNDHPSGACAIERDWKHMAVYYAATTSSGYGTIRCLPGFRDPLVRYNLNDSDLKDLSTALGNLSRLLFEAGAQALYPSIAGGASMKSENNIAGVTANIPRSAFNLMTVHLFSSCPMGEDQTRCAADSYGRVHGFRNLYISDASLLCTPPGVNPQGSIMAIAHRNAQKFLSSK